MSQCLLSLWYVKLNCSRLPGRRAKKPFRRACDEWPAARSDCLRQSAVSLVPVERMLASRYQQCSLDSGLRARRAWAGTVCISLDVWSPTSGAHEELVWCDHVDQVIWWAWPPRFEHPAGNWSSTAGGWLRWNYNSPACSVRKQKQVWL